MAHETINRLFAEKKGPCMSIIMPMHRLSPARMQNAEIHRKALRKAKSALQRKHHSEKITQSLLSKLNSLSTQFKPERALDGLGLFVSPGIVEMVNFPFPVKEKIVIDHTFETRDLHYMNQLLSAYYLLVIGKKNITFYSAEGDELHEIRDGQFPMDYEEAYEYAPPSRGSSNGNSLKAFEKDKSVLSNIRMQAFFRQAAQHVAPYLERAGVPLFVAGTKKQLAEFRQQSGMDKKISGEVIGSFVEKNFSDLRFKAWMSFTTYRQKETKTKIKEFSEKNTPEKLAKGIQEVWQAAHEGRGLLLMVEKDYTQTSYLRDGDPMLYLRAPKGKYTLVPDAVDEIIETVLDKGGKVLFTEDKKLRAFDSIALSLRY